MFLTVYSILRPPRRSFDAAANNRCNNIPPMPAPPIDATPNMYCRGCGYALIGLPSNRCPECGRDFDPANPLTFLARPPRNVRRRVVAIVLVLLCLMLPLTSYVGYLDWQVRRESKAIELLRASKIATVTTYDTTPRLAKFVFHGHAAWLWQRADKIFMIKRPQNIPQFMAAVGDLKSLQTLDLGGVAVTNSDLAKLKGLKALQNLFLVKTSVTDAGLENLKGLTALKGIWLGGTSVTAAGVADLQKALPACKIYH